jgi:hypothetical protein
MENGRDEGLVDLMDVPFWLARPVLQDDDRLNWEQVQTRGPRRYVLVSVDETKDDPRTELREAFRELARLLRALRDDLHLVGTSENGDLVDNAIGKLSALVNR